MITYLHEGWYTHLGQRRLRNEVVDGAIDTASMLFRAGVPPQAITQLALKIRTLATIADPPHRRGLAAGFATAERAAILQRLQNYTDRFPALQSFITDCFEHVTNATELRALYLHLVHVTQMMQLLMVAKLSGAAGGLFPPPGASIALPTDGAVTPKKTNKKAGRKKAGKKKAGTKKATKKKATRTAKKVAAKRPAPRKAARKAPVKKKSPRKTPRK